MEPIERALAEDRLAVAPSKSLEQGTLSGRSQEALSQLEAAVELVDQWSGAVEAALANGADAKAMQPFYDVDQRMMAFRQSLAEAGVFGDQLSLLGAVDDESEVSELERLGAEAGWQMASMGHEAARRWPEWSVDPQSVRARCWLDAIETSARPRGAPTPDGSESKQANPLLAAEPIVGA